MSRPSNDEYFLGIAQAVSKRATCGRRMVGTVLTDRNHNIISTGYNSVASGIPHCPDEALCAGAFDKSGDSSRCIARHSEDIAIAKCSDIYKIHTCYVTASPCVHCVRRLLDTSCKRVVFIEEYTDTTGRVLWESRGLQWSHVEIQPMSSGIQNACCKGVI
jgi:dCMP deaminase